MASSKQTETGPSVVDVDTAHEHSKRYSRQLSSGRYCSAPNCHNSSTRNTDLSFHMFPHKNKDRLEKWITNSGRTSYKFDKMYNYHLCDIHFENSQFMCPMEKGSLKKKKRLLPDAVPTLFHFTESADNNAVLSKRVHGPKRTQSSSGRSPFETNAQEDSPTKSKRSRSSRNIVSKNPKQNRSTKHSKDSTTELLQAASALVNLSSLPTPNANTHPNRPLIIKYLKNLSVQTDLCVSDMVRYDEQCIVLKKSDEEKRVKILELEDTISKLRTELCEMEKKNEKLQKDVSVIRTGYDLLMKQYVK